MWQVLLSPISETISEYLKYRKLDKEKKYELQVIKYQAEIEHAKNASEYDVEAQRQMQYTWKDEYLVIVFTFPFILSFITPYIALYTGIDLTDQLEAAWELVEKAPRWYQIILAGIIAATFGLRWYIRGKVNGKPK